MKIVTVPSELEESSFDQLVKQLGPAGDAGASAPPERRLFDARRLRWVDPYGMVGLLATGEVAGRGGERPVLQLPDSPDVSSYLARMGFLAQAESIFELHGTSRPAREGASDVLLEITPVHSHDDVHTVVERVQGAARTILTKHLDFPPMAVAQFSIMLSEVCQNILEHAGAPGWVAAQTYTWRRRLGRKVAVIAVMDLGVGFKGSLASAQAARWGEKWGDSAALEAAFLHGITRFPDPGRGQGLQQIRKQVGRAKVICGLSGGVDSAVAAVLIHEAIGDQLTCVLVDTGLMRLGEAQKVVTLFRDSYNIPLVHVDGEDTFLKALAGVEEPEQKRKIIGKLFIDVFEAEAKKIGGAEFLAQGTLYPDVIESVSVLGGPSATIKSHHNVGGLPERMHMQLVEPLRELFKDEVRALGRELGLPEAFVGRHPFPGPGLAIRCPGAVTREKLDILRLADEIFIEEIRRTGLYDDIWQAFAVLLPVKTVGVMGDFRTYEYVVGLRAVTSTDGMTADFYPFDMKFLGLVATRIINEVKGVNRVVYDVTSKPPGTIEWE